jgi:hypothetical protein
MKKLKEHPATVDSQDIIKPITFPNTSMFIAIKTASGNAGIIDSKTIRKHPKNKLIKILLLITKS